VRMDYETGSRTIDRLSGALWLVVALGLVALFILVNSHRVPRAEPDVVTQVEAHFAVAGRSCLLSMRPGS
jgi:hypothetical protein